MRLLALIAAILAAAWLTRAKPMPTVTLEPTTGWPLMDREYADAWAAADWFADLRHRGPIHGGMVYPPRYPDPADAVQTDTGLLEQAEGRG